MKKFISIIFLVFVFAGNAQEFKLSPYTQYLADNPFTISPAYAGIDTDIHRLRLSGVFQWVGLDDAPRTYNLSYDTRVWERSGAGGILYIDKNGNTSQTGGQISFAHHLTINDSNEQYISFGISYKFVQFKVDTSHFETYGPDADSMNDPAIGADISSFNSNFEVAVLYKLENFYFSLNASNLFNKSIKAFDDTEPKKIRNYYVYTGYVFDVNDGAFEIEPSLYFKYFESDSRSVSDINVKARKYTDDGYMWAGFNTRFINDQSFEPLSISPMLGLRKQKFYVAYGFQYNINEAVALNNTGTHLLTLGYDFDHSRGNSRW
ncbi:MAG: type IX secretion system membrane protein PorP/SprF [Bacteroidota bacterium]